MLIISKFSGIVYHLYTLIVVITVFHKRHRHVQIFLHRGSSLSSCSDGYVRTRSDAIEEIVGEILYRKAEMMIVPRRTPLRCCKVSFDRKFDQVVGDSSGWYWQVSSRSHVKGILKESLDLRAAIRLMGTTIYARRVYPCLICLVTPLSAP